MVLKPGHNAVTVKHMIARELENRIFLVKGVKADLTLLFLSQLSSHNWLHVLNKGLGCGDSMFLVEC